MYVQSFPLAGARWKVSEGGAIRPTWSRRDHKLFFHGGDRIKVVPYGLEGNSFIAQKPAVWSETAISWIWPRRYYDISPDDKTAVVLRSEGGKPVNEMYLTFLLNFPDELRRRLRAKPIEREH